jgi:hypothetical protein
MSSLMTPVLADIEHPTFMESAALFVTRNMLGHDMNADSTAALSTEIPCLFTVRRGNSYYTINFDKFPSPKTAHVYWSSRDTVAAEWILSQEVLTEYHANTGDFIWPAFVRLDQTHMRFIIHNSMSVDRQLKALQYIRDNFCAGEPDPPESPF